MEINEIQVCILHASTAKQLTRTNDRYRGICEIAVSNYALQNSEISI